VELHNVLSIRSWSCAACIDSLGRCHAALVKFCLPTAAEWQQEVAQDRKARARVLSPGARVTSAPSEVGGQGAGGQGPAWGEGHKASVS
jgi:hypothetical protein